MYDAPQTPSEYGYGALTFGGKISAAIALTKSRGLTIFATLLVGGFVLSALLIIGSMVFGGASMLFAERSQYSGFAFGAIFGYIIVCLAFALLSQYFMIGVNSLILKYVDGYEPDGGVVSQVLSPWHNFMPILLCVIVWFLLTVVINIVLAIFLLIPILGILINLAGSLFLIMVMNSVLFYIADTGGPSVGDVVTTPIRLVKDNFISWLLALVTAVVVYLPGVVILGLIMLAGKASVAWVLGGLIVFVYFTAASIFTFIFFAITYRQTNGDNMGAAVGQAF